MIAHVVKNLNNVEYVCVSHVVIKFKSMKMNEVIGSFLKGYRKARGYTLEQIASASHRYGTGWSAATILSMEKGGSKVDSLPNVLLLVQTLNDIANNDGDEAYVRRDLTIGDALALGGDFARGEYRTLGMYEDEDGFNNYLSPVDGPDPNPYQTEDTLVYLTDNFGVQEGALSDAFNDVGVNLPEWGESFTEELSHKLTAREERSERLSGIIAAHYGKDYWDLVRDVLNDGCDSTMSEKRATEKLGMDDSIYFNVICLAKYGRRLNEEVAARVGSDANQQKRGRMTRKIVEELRELLEKADHGEL